MGVCVSVGVGETKFVGVTEGCTVAVGNASVAVDVSTIVLIISC